MSATSRTSPSPSLPSSRHAAPDGRWRSALLPRLPLPLRLPLGLALGYADLRASLGTGLRAEDDLRDSAGAHCRAPAAWPERVTAFDVNRPTRRCNPGA